MQFPSSSQKNTTTGFISESHSSTFASQSLASGCNFWAEAQTKDLIFIRNLLSRRVHFSTWDGGGGIPRHLRHSPLMAPGFARRNNSCSESIQPDDPQVGVARWRHRICVHVCVRMGWAATAPLSPAPFHSFKPRSVFIDAVYFVLYQINNKTHTRPEERRRKVVHCWVGPKYIRSALSALCAWPCMFTIMHLRNNNRNKTH